jgi:hypothetical protein
MVAAEEMPKLRLVRVDDLDGLAELKEPVEEQARQQALEIITDIKVSSKDFLRRVCWGTPVGHLTVSPAPAMLLQTNGKPALLKHATRLGDIKSTSDQIILGRDDMEKAWNSLTQEQQGTLQRTK